MNTNHLPLALLASLALAPTAARADDTARRVIAVFDIEDLSGKIQEPERVQLTIYLAAKLAESTGYEVVPRDRMKTALAAHPEKAIAERAKKLLAQGGGLPDPDRQKVIEGLAAVLKNEGDAAAGKKLFAQHCGKCHKHGGEGQQIGPDLTGFAVHPKEEILIAVLDPSRSVEGNYRTYTATLLDGRVITVDGALWPGLGYLWAVAMVEDLDRLFGAGDPSASASPRPTS